MQYNFMNSYVLCILIGFHIQRMQISESAKTLQRGWQIFFLKLLQTFPSPIRVIKMFLKEISGMKNHQS